MDKKILVIDDHSIIQERFLKYGGEQFESLRLIGMYQAEHDLPQIEEALTNKPYVAILMDGELELRLDKSRQKCDGEVLTQRLRSGTYGQLNRDTPVYNISSSHEISDAVGHLDKIGIEDSVAFLREKYLDC